MLEEEIRRRRRRGAAIGRIEGETLDDEDTESRFSDEGCGGEMETGIEVGILELVENGGVTLLRRRKKGAFLSSLL